MKRRQSLGWLFAAMVMPITIGFAQPVNRVWRIGYLASGFPPPNAAPPAPLRASLRDLGYVEGRNLTFINRWAELRSDLLAQYANELVALKPDVIVAFGFLAADAVKRATASIPIVFFSAGDASGTGLVASLAHPGANLTGLSDQSTELSAKRLELLKEFMPGAARVGVLWNANNPGMTHRYHEIEKAADVLHVKVLPLAVRAPEDFDAAFAAMMRERPDALLVVTDAVTNRNRDRVFEFVAKNGMPTIYETGDLVRNGGLMSYGQNPDDDARRIAVFIDRVLKGARPGDLPVEQPTQFELVINVKTARALGIAIPPGLLMRASEVVQ